MRIREAVAATVWTVAAVAGAAGSQEQVITVRVLDNVGLSGRLMRGATMEAQRILLRAGVATEWLLCSPSETAEGQDPRCHSGHSRGDLSVGIVSRSMEGQFPISQWAMGVSVVSLEEHPSSNAYVFHSRVADFMKRIDCSDAFVLGDVIAHEIGHLLLGPAHASQGIMRASWDRQLMAKARWGQLDFTAEQVDQLKPEVSRRAKMKETATNRLLPAAR